MEDAITCGVLVKTNADLHHNDCPGTASTRHTPTIFLLPHDILYDIFLLCYGANGEEQPAFALVASQVCQKWRELALVVGPLWSVIRLDKPLIHKEALEIRLRRSGETSLHVIFTRDLFERGSLRVLSAVCDVILPHVHRCRTLELDKVPSKITRTFMDRLREKPLLRLESLLIRDGTPEAIHRISFGTFLLPSLTHLSIQRTYLYEEFALLLRGIITLKLFSDPHGEDRRKASQDALWVLSHAPRLRELKFEPPIFDRYENVTPNDAVKAPPPIRHLCLRRLDADSGDTLDAILGSIELPSLRYLSGHYFMRPKTLSAITPKSSLSALECLNVNSLSAAEEWTTISGDEKRLLLIDLPRIIEFKNVKYLRLYHYKLQGATSLETIAREFPKLQELKLLECRGFTADDFDTFLEYTSAAFTTLMIFSSTQNLTSEQDETLRNNIPNFQWAFSPPW